MRYGWSGWRQSSIWALRSTTRFGGRQKNEVAGRAFRDITANKCSRHRAIPGCRDGISVSRPRKNEVRIGASSRTDLFLRVSRAGLEGEVTVYRNAIDNFIYYAPTGSLDPRFGHYPVYQARGNDAVFTGTEASLRWEPVRGWALEAVGSTVRADRDGADGREPLSAIPPAQGRLRVRRDVPCWFAEVGGWIGSRSHSVLDWHLLAPGLELLPRCESQRINQGVIRCWSSLIAVHFHSSTLQSAEGGDDAN